MAYKNVAGNFELRDIDARAFLLLRIDLCLARVGNKIGLPNPLPVVGG